MFIVLAFFSFIPINCLFLDPVAKALSDFDVYDIVYSKLREDPKADTNIVLVNIGNLSRLEIARQVNVLNSYNPKIIAIDAIFQEAREHRSDSILADALSECQNLILVSKLEGYKEETGIHDAIIHSVEIFNKSSLNGFANLPNDDRLTFRTIREFKPYTKTNGSILPSFTAKITEIYDSSAHDFLMKRNKLFEKINYKGNYDKFFFLDVQQVLSGGNDLSFIKNKIVLMGFMETDFNHKTLEDIYFTPLNERFAGKSFPDMYGVVIHANILSMILNRNYINEMPKWLSILLAVILSYLSAYIIYNLKKNYKDWFSALTKIYILIISLLNLFIGVMILHYFNYRINLTLALAVIVLTNTIVEIYQSFISRFFPSLEK